MNTSPKTPHAIGIIIDGNRRWAKAHGLPTQEGHRRGYERVKDLLTWANEHAISCVTIYTFSTENWKRSEDEVTYLMDLLKFVLINELNQFKKDNIRLRIIGERAQLSDELQTLIAQAETETADATGPTLALAISYGGRAEIVAAANGALQSGKTTIDEAELSSYMWTAGLPDPDIIVRTGGETRLSGFLTWQSVYSELYFSKTLWPDFSKEEFEAILADYTGTDRRYGK
jgi:undecaprenyl diphosphate synthase